MVKPVNAPRMKYAHRIRFKIYPPFLGFGTAEKPSKTSGSFPPIADTRRLSVEDNC